MAQNVIVSTTNTCVFPSSFCYHKLSAGAYDVACCRIVGDLGILAFWHFGIFERHNDQSPEAGYANVRPVSAGGSPVQDAYPT